MQEVARQEKRCKRVVVRTGLTGRPVFAKSELYKALEQQGVKCAIRLLASDCLKREQERCDA